MKLIFKFALTFLICTTILLRLNSGVNFADTNNVNYLDKVLISPDEQDEVFQKPLKYSKYIESREMLTTPAEEVMISAIEINSESADDYKIDSYLGKENVLFLDDENKNISFEIEVLKQGMYCIEISYAAIPDSERDILFEILIDNQIPFLGADVIKLDRIFKDVLFDGEFEQDNRGNDLVPQADQVYSWQEKLLSDTDGLNNSPYKFEFKGRHKISLNFLNDPIAIEYIKIYNPVESDYYTNPEYANLENEYFEIYQAEKMSNKSHRSIYAVNDKSNPATQPSNPVLSKLNIISGNNFRYNGQWVEWEIEAPESGYYKLGARYRQNYIRGFNVNRKCYINNDLQFLESESIKFPYSGDFSFTYFNGNNNEPYLFFLNEGENTIKLEVSLAEFAEIISLLQDSISELNKIYLKIIRITGTYPDSFRDYKLQDTVPGMTEGFTKISSELKNIYTIIHEEIGYAGSEASVIKILYEQIDSMLEEPNTIPSRLTRLKDNISGVAAWILLIREQPLDLDYLCVASGDSVVPQYSADIITKIIYNIKSFIGSFYTDYNSVGNTYNQKNAINVWIGSGRDQAIVLNSQIRSDFTKINDIEINLKIVQGALLQAIMSGQGPDVALNVGRGDPVNLGMRGALHDLSDFSDFSEMENLYMPGALVPYKFLDSYYALPETQNFHMMFYRKDILEDLQLNYPKTWDELYLIAPVIQQNNMDIGLPYAQIDAYSLVSSGMAAQSIFPTLLLQRGGSIYSDDLRKTNLLTPQAYDAFTAWTAFYNQYSFPLFKDDYSRFRTGEMPIVIAPYTFFNQISAAAPEINGLWKMVPIPGTLTESGEINRNQAAMGSACIMIELSQKKEAAWEFMKWWVSGETQTKFAYGIEGLLGIAGRYNPANIEAFNNIHWLPEQKKYLLEQWKQVQEIPEVPGGYYTSRNIDNAFRAVILSREHPREALFYWDKQTNEELNRKWNEFGNR